MQEDPSSEQIGCLLKVIISAVQDMNRNFYLQQIFKQALEQAKIANDEGLINFLGERLEVQGKHGWFLRASTKTNRA